MNPNFEQALTRGRAYWIASYVHDIATSTMVIELARDTDNFRPTIVVEFSGVQNIEHRWLEEDDARIEGLLGAHEYQRGALYQYLLVTDQREIEFTARAQAEIKSVQQPASNASTLRT